MKPKPALQPIVPIAYGYCRVSTKAQAEVGQGMEVQEEAILRYYEYALKPKKFAWGGMVRDPAQSGRMPIFQRKGGMELQKLLRRGDAVVFSKLDRGFRNAKDLLQSIDHWNESGVGVHLLDLNVDTTTPMGRMILGIAGMVAQFDAERKLERVMEAKYRMVEQGYWPNDPRRPPYGFKCIRKNNHHFLVPDPDYPGRKLNTFFLYLNQEKGWDKYAMEAYCVRHGILGVGGVYLKANSIMRKIRQEKIFRRKHPQYADIIPRFWEGKHEEEAMAGDRPGE